MAQRGISFWSIIVPAGKEVVQELDNEENLAQYIHVTNAAVAPKTKPEEALTGLSTLFVESDGTRVALCTLGGKAGALQHALDFVIDQTLKFKNAGTADIHVCGYNTVDVAEEQNADDSSDEGEDEDEDEDDDLEEGEDEEDSDDVPDALPLKGLKQLAAAAAARAPKNKKGAAPDSDDIPDFDELNSDDMIAEQDEDEDEDEDFGGEGDDDDDDDDDDAEMEDVPVAGKKQPQVALGAKRPAAATPQPAGKALRMDAGAGAKAKAAPASAPPKASGKDGKKQEPATAKQAEPTKGVATPSNEAEYKDALLKVLKAKGSMSLSELGQAVKRPASLGKITDFVKKHPQVFDYNASKQTMTLKK